MTLKEKLQEPAKVGFLVKLLICINLVGLSYFCLFAYISDIEIEEEQQYYNYLENRIEIQSELIELQQELINVYKSN